MLEKWLALAMAFCAVSIDASAMAATVTEPPVFASVDGVLDILMVATAVTVTGFHDPAIQPTGWAYQICPRPATGNQCPADTATIYGGARLALQPGDQLKIRFVNNLPPVDPAALTEYVDDPLLALNPTNLHTHGLVVPAAANTIAPPGIPVYGDFILTDIFNPANGDPAAVNPTVYSAVHAHYDIVKGGVVNYAISIPANHPRGAFMFHPHVHGNVGNQVAAGMFGLITVGKVGAYACNDLTCAPVPESLVRHLLLKDMQIPFSASNVPTPQFQVDPEFCPPTPLAGEKARDGVCPADRTAYPNGGFWFFAVNGEQFPTIRQMSPDGAIWRIQNAAASMTYDLTLVNDWTNTRMAMQLLSMDGVSVNIPEGTPAGTVMQLGGNRFKITACPTAPATNLSASAAPASSLRGGPSSQPICIDELIMMPASRVELWTSYHNSDNELVEAPFNSTATLRNTSFTTGPIGDSWPSVDLAKVAFVSGSRSIFAKNVIIGGDALRDHQPGGIFASVVPGAADTPLPAHCSALPAGHRRRIYFGNPGTGTDANGNAIFGIGYEEIDGNGVPVPGTFTDVTPFDPTQIICLPLAKGQMPAIETWEVINLAQENHNFHIHQTKFRVISMTALPGSVLASDSKVGAGLEGDVISLPYAQPAGNYQFPISGSCPVADYKAGKCLVSPVLLQIPFSKLGVFVFHCHILDHEDAGMMHAIRVVPSPD